MTTKALILIAATLQAPAGWDWKPIKVAPTTGEAMTVVLDEGGVGIAWYDNKINQWRDLWPCFRGSLTIKPPRLFAPASVSKAC